MQTKFLPKLAVPVSVIAFTLTACSGGGSNGLSTTSNTDNNLATTVPIDWTGRACESPAFRNTLGTYTGELQFQDSAARSCRWSAEITIAGSSALATEDCNLSGNIEVTLIEQGTQLEESPYLCAEINQATDYATGLQETLDLNIATPTSFQLQLEAPFPEFDVNGLALVNAVTQFESIVVGGDRLTAVTGTIERGN